MATGGPNPSQIAKRTITPMTGAAWPILAIAVTTGLRNCVDGRVNTIPNGIAVTSTNAADMTTMSRCSHVKLKTEAGAKVRASISSKDAVERQIAHPTTEAITRVGIPRI